MNEKRARQKRQKNATESQVQKTCLEYLRLNGIFCARLNNLGVPLPGGGFRPAPFKGLPDAVMSLPMEGLFIHACVWVEFKTRLGKLSEHQVAVKNSIEKTGGFYWVVRSLDDLQFQIKSIQVKATELEK